MKFAYQILYVESVVISLAFYQDAFGFSLKMMTPEEDYGELDTGETTLAFARYDLASTNLPGGFHKIDRTKPFGMELAFTTEEIEADFAKAIAAGADLIAPIQEKPWGQKVGYLIDINGFLIEVCTPMADHE